MSSYGRVRSLNYLHTGKTKVLKPGKNGGGYLSVHLYKNGKKKMFKVHRIVASAFIPNPTNKPQVNHKNEIKTNNCVENLEWMTRKENLNYGTRNERISKAQMNNQKKSKPVLQFTKEGELIAEYPSTREAERQTGIDNRNIASCCRGKLNSVGGYCWKYLEV